jgi:hypothetical protein
MIGTLNATGKIVFNYYHSYRSRRFVRLQRYNYLHQNNKLKRDLQIDCEKSIRRYEHLLLGIRRSLDQHLGALF